jgi:alpha-galactosidase
MATSRKSVNPPDKRRVNPPSGRRVKIAFVGGGSQSWAPRLIRDIVFQHELKQAELEIALLDPNVGRARAIKRLFDVLLEKWRIGRVQMYATQDAKRALRGADFALITISTGGLEAMRHDLEIPERYGIYHTVGDTVGPGGWARALRNIPVFQAYAQQIKKLAPNAYVLNYTNPMGALTKVLSDELGHSRVVGLCHGMFETYEMLKVVLGITDERELKLSFGGLNHFFWVLDISANGRDGYELLRSKLRGRTLVELFDRMTTDQHGWSSRGRLASELFEQYGYLSYIADRHICEFFGSYITSKAMMDRFKLVRTSIGERAASYSRAANWIEDLTAGRGRLETKPSRETAADIMAAITFDRGFADVVNMANIGQIPNLPMGAVVETMGYVDAGGARPLTVGPFPEQLRALCAPHAEVQLRTVKAGLSGDLEEALMALVADPVCATLTASDVKKMGRELLKANKQYLPQFRV